jgi:hypothetical protein
MNQPAAPPDPFFELIPDGEWNACIGSQGDELNYVDGYIEAALELVSAVVDKRLVGSRDTLAMPILYNARHGIELSLKFAINELHQIGMVTTRHVPNHDIRSHWQYLIDAAVGDKDLRGLITDLGPYVLSLARIDDDGQELRYATNRDGKKSLEQYPLVNLLHIRNSLQTLKAMLTKVQYRILELSAERGTGTFTKECSRRDLERIAGMLGEHASWKDESFDEKKASIRSQFGLTSNTFSNAVTKIRSSHPLAALVGLEMPLKYLSDDKAIFALQQWALVYPPVTLNPNDLGIDFWDRDWEEMKKHNAITSNLVETITSNLSCEELADLEVLFYIGRDGVFGEDYGSMLNSKVAELKSEYSRLKDVYHIVTKTNLLPSVIKGAEAVGRPALAAKLRTVRPDPGY